MRMMELNLANRLAHAALASAILLAVVGMRGALAADPAAAPAVYAGWPFDAVEAQRRQQETAGRLGLPAEVTLDLGNGVTMNLALIPAGGFVMGSPEDEASRSSDEGPQREVTISRPFYMGIHEVTQAQWRAVMGDAYLVPIDEPQCPVNMVTWNEAGDFCRHLSRQTGLDVRLPTEAQWEYACRSGTATRFDSGEGIEELHLYANYCDQSHTGDPPWKDRRHSDGFDEAAPVGSLRPNPWGLCDMRGNVVEWCQDWYADSYEGAALVDPTGPASGSERVLRGGAWLFNPQYCRSAFRHGMQPIVELGLIGFRVVVVPPGRPE